MFELSKFPEAFRDCLLQALAFWKASAVSPRKELTGKSGAYVWLVDIATAQYDGPAILKFASRALISDELSNHKIASHCTPKNAIPEIVGTFEGEEQSAFLMSVAGAGLLEVDPLTSVPNKRLNVALGSAAHQVLSVWNSSSSFTHSRETASSVVCKLVQRQISEGSRIPDFMHEYTGLEPGARSFRYNGRDYPNPMSIGMSGSYGEQIDLATIQGAVHGDLHHGNILVARYEDKPSIYIIDFEKFRKEDYLFFDDAYLELSLLLLKRETLTPQRWAELCQDLRNIEQSQDGIKATAQEDVGLLFSIGALRYERLDWSRSLFPNRVEDIKKQVLLARIAAGIDFCNKRSLSEDEALSKKMKFFSFLYAAEAARNLLEYSRIPVPTDGSVINVASGKPLPKTEDWKHAWSKCNRFDEKKACYILIADGAISKYSEFCQKTLSRMPWSLIVDLDENGLNSVFSRVGLPLMQQRQSSAHLLPHQIQIVDNLSSSTCWLAANSSSDGVEQLSLSVWKRQTLPAVRKLAGDIYRANVPKPIKLILIGDQRDVAKKRSIVSAIQEIAAGFIDVVLISDVNEDVSHSALMDDVDVGGECNCDLEELCLGIYQVIGDISQKTLLWIPVRTHDGVTKLEALSDEEASLFKGSVELVPASPSYIASAMNDSSEFLQGGTVSWDDLDARRDVDRDVTRQLVQHLRTRLLASPNESYSIDHSPGAGGTTVSRRVAWELRDDFPALVIVSFSTEVIEVIDTAFRRTSLPLLIIVEATHVSAGQRDFLYSELRGRNVRFLMLDVRRHNSPRDTGSSVALADPMTFNEAQRFFRVFSAKANADRKEALRALASQKEFEGYRSAFFFGLYSFEKNFKKIPEFVSNCLSGVSQAITKRICQISLISRYSQERISLTAFNVLLGIDAVSGVAEVEDILGPGPMKLIFMDSDVIGIKHPLLAEEILKATLQPAENLNPDAWRIPLNEFCIEFIDEIVSNRLSDSSNVLDILYDLYLERQSSDGVGKTRFSELIETLDSPHGERRVLEALTVAFPNNPFFLSHLARHMNYKRTGSFEDAERIANQAILMDDRNDEPYHVLGMIYRFEIERRLQVDTIVGLDLDNHVKSIDDLFLKARGAFDKAFSFSRDSNFPLISPIQMTIHTMGRIFSLSKYRDFAHFLSSNSFAAVWCRDKLDYAQSLFHELHRLEAVGEPSERRVRCDADFQQLLGNSSQVVSGLTALLKRADVRKGPIRRLISSAYLRDIKYWAKQRNVSVYREIGKLCEDNLSDNPASVIDLRLWLRAYRMLPDAAITVAIERFSKAAILSDEVEPRYYLMILHFLAHRMGFPGSLLEARRHQDFCRQHSTSTVGRKSLEWLANGRLGRPIPLVHHSELGDWDRRKDFFSNAGDLEAVEGRIDEIRSLQAGAIVFDGMPAFFVPRAEFRKLTDTNALVTASLGFSYEGLRAWNVQRK